MVLVKSLLYKDNSIDNNDNEFEEKKWWDLKQEHIWLIVHFYLFWICRVWESTLSDYHHHHIATSF